MFKVSFKTKMFTSMWLMSIASLLVVDVRTGALQQKDIDPRRCYSCDHLVNSTCDQSAVSIAECPTDRQYCATVAVAPNFTSSLQCAPAADKPCSLNYSKQTLELICVCNQQLCNAPFDVELLNALLNFSSHTPQNKSADVTESFFNNYFTNFSYENIYKKITVEVTTELPTPETSKQTTVSSSTTASTTTLSHKANAPRAEALKQEATVPSDDDEDEGEGSGSYEETRSQRHPASAPAAPSSFLPANENKSPPLYTHLFMTIPFMFFIV